MTKREARKEILVYADWIGIIKSKVSNWKSIANKYEIPKSEQLIIEKAFNPSTS